MTDQQHRCSPKNHDSPGAVLAQARKRKGIALADAARELKLTRSIVEQIEAGQFDRIAAIYRRGYISNYARLLGLDPAPLLNGLGPDEAEPLREVLPLPRSGHRMSRWINFSTYALVSAVIVAPLVYFFVLGGARLFEAEIGPLPGGDVTRGAALEQRPGYRDRIADALSMRAAGDDAGEGAHLSASALPLNAIRSLEPAALPETALGAPVTTIEPPADPRERLALELVADSWVEIEDADGQRLEFDLLRAGTRREYLGMPPFTLLLGRANAVSISLQGQSVSFDGADRAGVATPVIGAPRSGRSETAQTEDIAADIVANSDPG
ncbi:MAG: helix-turn-helix domain-containing protein [Wenzhouxiangellaceae bacterium]